MGQTLAKELSLTLFVIILSASHDGDIFLAEGIAKGHLFNLDSARDLIINKIRPLYMSRGGSNEADDADIERATKVLYHVIKSRLEVRLPSLS